MQRLLCSRSKQRQVLLHWLLLLLLSLLLLLLPTALPGFSYFGLASSTKTRWGVGTYAFLLSPQPHLSSSSGSNWESAAQQPQQRRSLYNEACSSRSCSSITGGRLSGETRLWVRKVSNHAQPHTDRR